MLAMYVNQQEAYSWFFFLFKSLGHIGHEFYVLRNNLDFFQHCTNTDPATGYKSTLGGYH